MGNLCSGNFESHSSGFSEKSILMSSRASTCSLSNETVYELVYNPKFGEGESLKVLFEYLGLVYKETITYGQDDELVMGPTIRGLLNDVKGTLPCLRALSRYYGLYPHRKDEIYKVEMVCELIYNLLTEIRGVFSSNNRRAIEWVYEKMMPGFLKELDGFFMNPEDPRTIFEGKLMMSDLLVFTFLQNFFFTGERIKYRTILTENAPLLTKLHHNLLTSHKSLAKYTKTRPFSLYI